MKHQSPKNRHDPNLSSSLQPDDGLDPRYDAKEASSGPRIDRKGAQLCAQVRRTLEFVVPEVLASTSWGVLVLDVQPSPNTSHLLVLLQSTVPLSDEDRLALEQEVARYSGPIRTAVAQAINRRKTPSLTFRVIPS